MEVINSFLSNIKENPTNPIFGTRCAKSHDFELPAIVREGKIILKSPDFIFQVC